MTAYIGRRLGLFAVLLLLSGFLWSPVAASPYQKPVSRPTLAAQESWSYISYQNLTCDGKFTVNYSLSTSVTVNAWVQEDKSQGLCQQITRTLPAGSGVEVFDFALAPETYDTFYAAVDNTTNLPGDYRDFYIGNPLGVGVTGCLGASPHLTEPIYTDTGVLTVTLDAAACDRSFTYTISGSPAALHAGTIRLSVGSDPQQILIGGFVFDSIADAPSGTITTTIPLTAGNDLGSSYAVRASYYYLSGKLFTFGDTRTVSGCPTPTPEPTNTPTQTPTPKATVTPTATPTKTPTPVPPAAMTLSTASTLVGSSVTVSLANFPKSKTATIQIDGKKVGSVYVGSKRSGSGAFTIPVIPGGSHTVTAVSGGVSAMATLTVNPSQTVSASTVKRGGSLTISVQGFKSNETVSVRLYGVNGSSKYSTIATFKVGSNGAGSTTVRISSAATTGTRKLATYGSLGHAGSYITIKK